MSHQASAWAWSVTVGDSTRKSVLAAIADHADPEGRHAWPSKETIAEKVECSVKTVRRAVAGLIEDGWLREGDQQQVAHLRGDRRPIVYDLAMNEATRQLWKAGQGATTSSGARGDTMAPRAPEATQTTGGQIDPPSSVNDRTPVTGRKTDTGGQPRPHGGTPVSPKQSLNRTTPPSPRQRGATGNATNGQQPIVCAKPGPLPHTNCRGCGTTTRQIAEQQRRAAEEARRETERLRIAEERARAEQLRAAGPSPQVAELVEQTRRQLAKVAR